MRKPIPEDFGLTENRIKDLGIKQDKVESIGISIAFGLTYMGSVIYMFPHLGWLSLFFAVATSIIIGGLLWMVIYGLISTIFFKEFNKLDKYRGALAKYNAWFVKTQEDFWHRLNGIGFEYAVAEVFQKTQRNPQLTSTTDDKGVDIILGDGTIVQCKAHKKPVPPVVARELWGTMKHFNAEKGILVSKSGFSKGVIEFVKGKPISLMDTRSLITLQRKLDY